MKRWLLLAALVTATPAASTFGAHRTPDWIEAARPDLLELTQRAELVVHGRVFAGNVKHPTIEIIEVLHGRYNGDQLHVVFRFLNHTREPGDRPIHFIENQELLLFLKRSTRVTRPDRFELVRNRYGQVEIPAEGGDALRGAVRTFSAFAAAPVEEHFGRLQAMLNDPNPMVASTALRQVRKHRIATAAELPVLLRFLRQGAEAERITAAGILEDWLAAARRRGGAVEREDEMLNLLIGAARIDPSVRVRTAAVGALQAWASPRSVEVLEIIAATDPSQIVRFQAELALLRIRRRAETETARP